MRRSPFDLPCQNTKGKKVWEIRDGNSSFFIKKANRGNGRRNKYGMNLKFFVWVCCGGDLRCKPRKLQSPKHFFPKKMPRRMGKQKLTPPFLPEPNHAFHKHSVCGGKKRELHTLPKLFCHLSLFPSSLCLQGRDFEILVCCPVRSLPLLSDCFFSLPFPFHSKEGKTRFPCYT